MSPRGSTEAHLTTIYWRDIPAQVTAKAGRQRARAVLSDRFQVAIDAAATKAGKTDADDYLAEWREERTTCDGDLDEAVHDEARRLEETFTRELLQAHVRNGGRAP
jgi:hypothetical protein